MNFIWVLILTASTIILIFKNPKMIISSFLSGSEQALELSLKLLAIYAFWLGILKIIEDTKLNVKFSKMLNKPIGFIFGKIPQSAKEQISLNLSCNMFGMGNASVPSGIKAIGLLDKGKTHATNSMIALLILNTCNLQIIPTTLIGMKALYGSSFPTRIVLPTILVSIICVSLAIFLLKIFSKIFKDKPND